MTEVRYVERNGQGEIVSSFANPQPGTAEEALGADDPALVAFEQRMAAALKPKPTPREWLDRLSQATQARIWQAAVGNPDLLGWVFYASGGPTVDVSAQKTIDGIDAMKAAGVLNEIEAEIMLAP